MAEEATSDAQLIERLAVGDRSAQALLAARYLDFVYTTARRLVGDAHTADDITQAVFIILMSKAKRLRPQVVLAGWLYRTTAYVAANALKMRHRRERHEQRAAAERSEYTMSLEPPTDPEALRKLDAAMLALASKHRDVLLLRYFQRRSIAQVGAALSISEEAAKKRVARALDRLRVTLLRRSARRGTATDVAAILAALPQSSAPPALHAAVAQGAAGGPAVQALVQGATLMLMSKSLITAAIVVLLLSGGAAAWIALKPADAPSVGAVARRRPPGKSTTTPADGRIVVPVPQGTVQLIAIGSLADQEWWSPSGDRRVERPITGFNAMISPENGKATRAFVLATGFVDNENGPPTSTLNLKGSSAEANGKVANAAGEMVRIVMGNVKKNEPGTLTVDIATGEWETLAELVPDIDAPSNGKASLFSVAKGNPKGADVKVVCDVNGDLRALAIDDAGRSHSMWPIETTEAWAVTPDAPWTVRFHARDIDPGEIRKVFVQRRPYTCEVSFTDLATEPQMKTHPRTIVGSPATQPSATAIAPPP